jgi:hypothetical protein
MSMAMAQRIPSHLPGMPATGSAAAARTPDEKASKCTTLGYGGKFRSWP